MSTKRVSNEQILTALTDLPAAIAAAMVGNVAPPQAPAIESGPAISGEDTVNIDENYIDAVKPRAQAYADKNAEDVILYARKNTRQETKLAYCLASKWTGLRDKRIIGAVAHLQAA